MADAKSSNHKSLLDQFTAENIDCTATATKVLDELRKRNPLAYSLYCRVLRPMRYAGGTDSYHFVIPGYPINTFGDDWNGELNLDYFEPFPYRSHSPKMITPMKNVHQTDPVTSILMKKYNWSKVSKLMKTMRTTKKVMESYEQLNEDVVQCPQYLVNLAAHLDSEPEPYFHAPYNWHYAGHGNLQPVCLHCADYLLHSQFTTVYLSEFNKNTLAINMDHVASFDCGEGNDILETIISSQNIVVLRTKHKIFILKLINTDESMTLEKLKCIKSEEFQYTGVSFDNFHRNILYITTLDYKLSIINLDRMKARSVQLKAKVPTLVNNWNTVISSERGFYIHAGRSSISIYDKSSNDMVHVWKDVKWIVDEVNCNDISAAEHFEESKSLYFGTDHHLFLMDLRSIKKTPSVVQRWTHGMESAPLYLKNCNFGFGKELICLCSQWCEDLCVVPNYTDRIKDTNSNGVTIPYRPPSIFSALREARWSMHCLDIYNPIEPRLVTAITGCLMFERDENYEILMQNSFGDISCHTLYPEHFESFIEDDSAEKLYEWTKAYEAGNKVLEVSSVDNMARFWKKLRKVPDGYKVFSYAKKPKSKFDEKEIESIFEEEEVDVGLQEAWAGGVGTTVEEPLARNVYFADEE
ncbi:uncharacterized protein LOC123874503 [Maniola jurtina]|uniref:uncharacterized protein LOC123874503 n=1 Tax=Maniola jurtina TaxID=191418 RepID=UPI001E68AE0A|nr:uncharacterized protein LOC123874503 [Maniola jurtina]